MTSQTDDRQRAARASQPSPDDVPMMQPPALGVEAEQRTGTCRFCQQSFTYEQTGVRMGRKLLAPPPRTVCDGDACRAEAHRESAERDARHEAAAQMVQAERRHAAYCKAVPPMFWQPTMSDGSPNPSVALPDHVIPELEAWTPDHSLALSGPVGCGKTHLVAALMHRAAGDRTIAWYGVRPLIGQAQASISRADIQRPRVLDAPTEPDVLVLDDWGVERPTDYAIEQLATVVELRYQAMKPVVVTFNGDDLGVLIDRAKAGDAQLAMERVVSRLAEMVTKRPGILLKMSGDDRRVTR